MAARLTRGRRAERQKAERMGKSQFLKVQGKEWKVKGLD